MYKITNISNQAVYLNPNPNSADDNIYLAPGQFGFTKDYPSVGGDVAKLVLIEAAPGGTFPDELTGNAQSVAEANISGIKNVPLALLQHACNPDNLRFEGTINRNSDNAVTSATFRWPDGVTGTFTATVLSSTFPGTIDAYTVTYNGTPARTITQPTMTRNAAGAVTVRPVMTVS